MDKMDKMDIMLLGCGAVGKTLVSRRLTQMLANRCNASSPGSTNEGQDGRTVDRCKLNARTTPTTGMQYETVTLKNVSVTLREAGNDMARLWHKYYKKADVVIFVIDAANKPQLATATVELLRVVQNPEMHEKPLIILYNRIDQSLCMDIESIRQFIHVARLRITHKAPVYDCPVSALQGWNFDIVIELLIKCIPLDQRGTSWNRRN